MSTINERKHQLDASSRPQRGIWAQVAAVSVVALLVIFARAPDRVIFGFLWAEDGQLYLSTAYIAGFKSLLIPYAGYLSVLPHFVAAAYSKMGPVENAAMPFVWVSISVLCISCSYLFFVARKWLPLPAAVLFGLAPVLVPLNGEVFLTITNLQWMLSTVLLALLADCLLSRSNASNLSHGARLLVLVILSLTGPFCVFYLPIVLAYLALTHREHRSAWTWSTIAAYFTCVCIQAILIVQTPPSKMAGTPGARASLVDYLHYPWVGKYLRFFTLDFIMPSTWIEFLGQHWGIAAKVVALATIAVVLMSGRRFRLVSTTLYILAIGLWVVAIWRLGDPHVDRSWTGRSARYFYEPIILVVWAILISVSTTSFRSVRYAGSALLVLIALTSISRFYVQTYPHPDVFMDAATGKRALFIAPGPPWALLIGP